MNKFISCWCCVIALSVFSLLALPLNANQALLANSDAPSEIAHHDLDTLIDHFKSSKKGDVEIAMFRKLSFSGTVEELPFARQHNYLSRTLARFAPQSKIVATQGIRLASTSGQSLAVYIIDELAVGMNTQLQVGDTVDFNAYHAYSSFYGPGLLVYSWQAQQVKSSGSGFGSGWFDWIEGISRQFRAHFSSASTPATLEKKALGAL